MIANPLTDSTAASDDDVLVAQAQGGSREVLEALIKQHQTWTYNIALRKDRPLPLVVHEA